MNEYCIRNDAVGENLDERFHEHYDKIKSCWLNPNLSDEMYMKLKEP